MKAIISCLINEAQEGRARLSIKYVEVEIAKRYKFQGKQRCGEAASVAERLSEGPTTRYKRP